MGCCLLDRRNSVAPGLGVVGVATTPPTTAGGRCSGGACLALPHKPHTPPSVCLDRLRMCEIHQARCNSFLGSCCTWHPGLSCITGPFMNE